MRVRRVVMACLAVILAACGGSDLEQRQAEVAEAGSAIMPFDLKRTTHFFEVLEDGGLQTVTANDDAAEQIRRQRSGAHLWDKHWK